MSIRNIFTEVPSALPEEFFQTLEQGSGVQIERIVSRGHCTLPDEWLVQERHEWVLLLEGEARLVFEEGAAFHLQKGDHLLIPAHTRHRVTWTRPAQDTLWLAVHYD